MRAGLALACILFLQVLMIWVLISVTGASEGAAGLASSVTVMLQVTPTDDATDIALNKNKLLQDVDQQKHTLGNWLWNNGAAVISSLALVIAGVFTLLRYLRDQRNERNKQREDRQAEIEKRAEERFQSAVSGLGDDKEGVRVGAAILLRTFLRPGYEQFYTQTYDLAVAHLRLPRTDLQPEDPDGIPHLPEDPNITMSPSTLRQALIIVFKEAFPLARSQKMGNSLYLDARGIQLDRAYLWKADLEQAWMPEASLRGANLNEANLKGAKLRVVNLKEARLIGANLREANLSRADLSKANLKTLYRGTDHFITDLSKANLSKANLSEVNLSGTILSEVNMEGANLSGADLRGTNLSDACLSGANLSGAKLGTFLKNTDYITTDLSRAKLSGADLTEADLRKANLSKVNLSGANLKGAKLSRANFKDANLSGADLTEADLSRANLEDASNLRDTNLNGVKGLTKEQLEAFKKARGAIIDEDITSISSQSIVSPS